MKEIFPTQYYQHVFFVLVTTEVNQCIDVKKQRLLRTACVCG